MDITPVGPGIFMFDAFSLSQCKSMLSEIEKSSSWEKAKIRTAKGSIFSNKRQQDVIQLSSMTPSLKQYSHLLLQRGNEVLNQIYTRKIIVTNTLQQFQRTQKAGRFMWHRDGYDFACIAYLSDQLSHGLVGGGTAFDVDSNIFEVKPVRGKAIVFNGSILHKGGIVRQGTKLSLVVTMDIQKDAGASDISGGGSSASGSEPF